MENQNYIEKAIPLIAVNQTTGKYELAQQSIKFLRSVPAPLGIVSVAGLYRTGKSYLLNRMLLNTHKPKQGFGVGPSINPCTKGLWCWGTPIKGKSQNGQSINIIVIDTEGIGALDQDQTHDTRIFTLAILASSCFIYNSVGSIDQNAIQNLSLVVNLTKSIQLKSSNKSYDQQIDADEIAHYFPTFYWVVRDFTLQLQNTQGKAITSKQYLENALAPIKSSSHYNEQIESKNNIRRLLTSFFKDRDCFTMILPITNQDELQNLDSVPFQNLRPEFCDQVMQFRKKVIQGLKIKTFNGKHLNGDMYCNMLSSYVGAINEGAVPNIQNAWNYMCQEQCQKIQDQCEIIFDQLLKDMKYPVEQVSFNQSCSNALDQAILRYRQKSIGDPILAMKYEKQLKQIVQSKILKLKEFNENNSKQFLQKKVLEAFNPVVNKIKQGGFQTFDEFEKSISSVYENLINSHSALPNAKQKCLQLYRKVQKQGAQRIFKDLSREIENLKKIFNEKQQKYNEWTEKQKSKEQSDRNNFKEQISTLEKDKFQLQIRIQRLQQEFDRLKKEKQSESEKLSKNLTFKQSQFENNRKSFEFKFSELEEKYESIERNFLNSQKEWGKDREINESKIKRLQNNIKEKQGEIQLLKQKYEKTNIDANFNLKQTMNKNERRISELQYQIQKLQNDKRDLNDQLENEKKNWSNKAQRFKQSQLKLKEELHSKKTELETMKDNIEMDKSKMEKEFENQRKQISKDKSSYDEENYKLKEKVIVLEEEIRKIRADLEAKQASFEQSQKFWKEDEKILKDNIQELKLNQQKALQEIRAKSETKISQQQIIIIKKIEENYITEMSNIKQRFESQKQKSVNQLESLRDQNKNLDIQLKLIEQQLYNEKSNFSNREFEASQKIRKLQEESKNLERIKNNISMQQETFFKERIYSLETEIHNLKEKHQNQVRQTEQTNKQCIIQLRVTYQRQMSELENNYQREKQRAQRKFDQALEQEETKRRQQVQVLDEEIQNLKLQFCQAEDDYKRTIKNQQYEIDLLTKQNENLTKLLNSLKETLSKKEDEYKRQIETKTLNFERIKQTLNTKLQELQRERIQLDKELINTNHELKKVSNEFERLKEVHKDLQGEYHTKREEHKLMIEEYKSKIHSKNEELMNMKIQYEKKNALLTQQNEYVKDNYNRLQQKLSKIENIHEQKMNKLIMEKDQIISLNLDKYNAEMKQLKEKYEELKKKFKDNQSNFYRNLQQMEKQKAIDDLKIINLQSNLATVQERKLLQVSTLQKDINTLRQQNKILSTNSQLEIQRLRQEIETLDRTKKDIETRYEKENSLLKNEIDHERKIRQTKQSSLQDKIQTLQNQLTLIRISRSSEQHRAQSSYNQQRIKIEESYNKKILEFRLNIDKQSQQYDDYRRKSDNEIKELKEQLFVERQGKQLLQVRLDKRVSQSQEQLKKLNDELNILKSERQCRGLQFQKILEKEKQPLKIKLNDTENKLKHVEKEKLQQFYEYEKQKARFTQQQANTMQQIEHFKDRITKLQKDKTKLDKQNQRLMAQKKLTKATSFIRFGNEQRKSTIAVTTVKKQKIQRKQQSQYKYQEEDKENYINQQMLLD